MKERIRIILIALLCAASLPAFVLSMYAARHEEAWNPSPVQVCLEQGEGFVARAYIQQVESAGEAVFQLRLQENYEIVACSYPDYAITASPDGFTLLTLRNVRYPQRITVRCQIPTSVISYDPNGGSFAASGSAEPLRVAYGPSVHLRVNTVSGAERIIRDDYVLTGWNTAPDGSGQHIGLGSRVTAEKNQEMTLYAEWARETPLDHFTWAETADGVALTAYLGAGGASLVLPDDIGGRPVTEISAGFASDITLEQLVIPDTVLRIAEGAFRDCAIGHIFFSDTLQQVSDAAFPGSRPRYWHINAVIAPRYQSISDIATFADKMDLLLLHQDERKLLLFSGCSMSFGMDSQLLADACPDYTVLNLGAVGGTNAQFQFECILPYIRSGDVLIHAPEQASPYQLMSKISCGNRIFIAVEGNFDLLAQVDMTTLGEGAFDCFYAFNNKRMAMEPCTYEDQMIPLNAYGDNAEVRAGANKTRFDEEYGLLTELITADGLDRLAGYYDRIRAAGGEVYLSYAPINSLCCGDAGQIADFAARWEQGMQARGYETISDLNDYVMDAKYFYDADYHLTSSGAEIRARMLTRDLLRKLPGASAE
ncbi:MAG: hypothetical protein IJE07_09295 [Clostridia bacterium]|nr:hypothetical protein [Clostridia bacterium]